MTVFHNRRRIWQNIIGELTENRRNVRPLPPDLLEDLRRFETSEAARVCDRFYIISDTVKSNMRDLECIRRELTALYLSDEDLKKIKENIKYIRYITDKINEELRGLKNKFIPSLRWDKRIRRRLNAINPGPGSKYEEREAPEPIDHEYRLRSKYDYNLPSRRRPNLDEYDARKDPGGHYRAYFGIFKLSTFG